MTLDSPPTIESLSAWLYETDPMNTCCKENECFDEYDRVASTALDLIEKGETTSAAVTKALALWFS